MAMAFGLVACAGAGGKGHGEILEIADYANVYIARNKTGFNLFDDKGQALLGEDYDSVEIIDNFVVYATNLDNSADRYFDLSGKEFQFAVAGLMIKNVTLISNINRKVVGEVVYTYNESPQAINIEYYDKLSGDLFNTVFKFDGTLLATNTDKKALDTQKSNLAMAVIVDYIEEEKFEDNTILYTKKLNCIRFAEVYKTKHSFDGTETALDYKTEVRIYNGKLDKVFNKTFDTRLVDMDYMEIYCAFRDRYEYVPGVFTEKATVVTIDNGKTIEFDIYNTGTIGTNEVDNRIIIENDLVVVSPRTSVVGNKPAAMYIPSSQKTLQILAMSVDYVNGYLVVASRDANLDIVYTVIDAKTLDIAKSNIKKISKNDNNFEIDGVLYNAKLQPLSGNSSTEYLDYRIVYQVGSDIYYIATKLDGSSVYYKNDQVLLRLMSNEHAHVSNASVLVVTNNDTYATKNYDLFDTSIVYDQYETSGLWGGNNKFASHYKLTKGYDTGRNLLKVTLAVFDQVFGYYIPLGATDFHVATEFYKNAMTLTISYKKYGDRLFTVTDRVFMANVTDQDAKYFKVTLVQEDTIKVADNDKFTHVNFMENKLSIIAIWDDTSKVQGGNSKYKTTVYTICKAASGTVTATKLVEIDKHVESMGNYLVENVPGNSNYNNVYTMTGKKIVNGQFMVMDIVGDLARISLDYATFGIIALSNDGYKVLEEAKHVMAMVVGINYYVVVFVDKKTFLPQMQLKDSKGKTIIVASYNLTSGGGGIVSNDQSSVVDGKSNFIIGYQAKAGGEYYYLNLGRVSSAMA